ncbi:MAG: hypothetical protein PHX64_00725 [Candidatus Omnitrophica bacterium]|nr:hypothetical protein [Candidatus Omnitrophota bacterium]MDD5310264.1 hypothetical protein [Candidatus Omnitrophota bacterium]MDD5546158.1 hypothetical protein [Candidatus Omnitrophota bacterium]
MQGKDSLSNYEKLKAIAEGEGASLFGVADVSSIKDGFIIEPKSVLKGLDRGISIGVRLSGRIIETVVDEPSKIYAFHYKRVNSLIDEITLKLANHIQESGYSALPVPASLVEDWGLMRATLSHREIGRLAGLGFTGRSGLLINPEYGARVRYGTVLTDMPLKSDKPVDISCGKCAACVAACPAKAIKKDPKDMDLKACRELLKTFANKAGIGHSICGVCVRVCKGKQQED